MSAGDKLNNPGDFLSAGVPNFQGITSTSGTYAQFDSMSSGVRAIAVDVGTAIKNGYNTLYSLTNHYLGTTNLQPNSQNANPAGYLSALEKATGLGPYDKLTSSNVSSVVSGIIQGEGSHVSTADFNSGIARAGYVTTNQQQVGSLYSNFTAGLDAFSTHPFDALSYLGGQAAAGTGSLVTNPSGFFDFLGNKYNNGAAAVSGAASDTAKQVSDPVTTFLSGLFSQTNLNRAALIILGLLMLAAAFFALSRQGGGVNITLPKVA
jgi:hypothetical protein